MGNHEMVFGCWRGKTRREGRAYGDRLGGGGGVPSVTPVLEVCRESFRPRRGSMLVLYKRPRGGECQGLHACSSG